MKKLALLSFILLSACAAQTSQRVVVDPQGVDMGRYNRDLSDCEYLADQSGSTGQKAATGAVVGAVVGGLLGAAVGNSDTAQAGAGAGALIGGVGATGQTLQDKDSVVKNCMRGRGYRVLN